jgi:hypothetical protein
MNKPKLFIASSGRASELAEGLEYWLNDKGIEAIHWREETFHNGSILEKLLRLSREVDFAAILLTEDDFKEIRGNYLAAPRDNCIFELGLFIGALGLSIDRCFMITSLESTCLPSDLSGQIYIGFKAPSDLADSEACKDVMRSPAIKISGRIKGFKDLAVYRRPAIPLLSLDEVLSLEKPREKSNPDSGHLLPNSTVMVHASQPIETSGTFAPRVLSNMGRRIRYHYFFSAANDDCFDPIASMIQTLAAVGVKEGSAWEDLDERRQLELLSDPTNAPIIERNLKDLGRYLFIYFIPHIASEVFCVHNAGKEIADCYLRWDPRSFLKLDGTGAEKVEAYKQFKHPSQDTVFGDSAYIKVDDIIAEGLRDKICNMFPAPLDAKVSEICFGNR